MSDFVLKQLPQNTDPRGVLTVLEKNIPFEIKRVFWVRSDDGALRGGHRHHHTRQALIAIHGRVQVYLNDGVHEQSVDLDHDGVVLMVEPEDWHTMTFEPGSVLLVLASHLFDPNDYIRQKYP